MSRYHQGRFRPKNPEKVKGDVTNIIYRSSWELKTLIYLDDSPDVLSYSSEEIKIPYSSKLDGKLHIYYPDFCVTARQKDGNIVTFLIEVKPEKQTRPPIQGKSKRTYITEVKEWAKNTSKWEAAKRYCQKHDMKFVILTEKNLGILY